MFFLFFAAAAAVVVSNLFIYSHTARHCTARHVGVCVYVVITIRLNQWIIAIASDGDGDGDGPN